MDDPVERELLEMLQEPTADSVRRKVREQDAVMYRVGRAMAPHFNDLFADLHKRITKEEG